ncbi:uncharacterized protein LOC134235804 [Saccostrea cucullata]|uniref:uncharacterized protein LOC134235804 n=1 Tax=Saccostrea cuccullata TaxID=36930 RepID=UPI002ED14127
MNSVPFALILLFIGSTLFTLAECTIGGTVNCYQCNVFNQGAREFCANAERKMYNCTGCMKTKTRVYMHDQWLRYKYVTVISKYCIQYMNYKLEEGCYTKSADQGYIRRCYCYSHWCNSANKNSNRTLVTVGLQVLFTFFVFNWIRGS